MSKVAETPFDQANLDFAALGRVIWRGKWIIVTAVLLCGGASVAYALLASRWYRADIVLLQADSRGGLRGLNSIAGLASLAGINISSGGQSQAPLAKLRSRELIVGFINDQNLLPVLFADDWDHEAASWKPAASGEVPDLMDGLQVFGEKVRSVSEDRRTGLVTLSISWKDPNLAAEWANGLAARLNAEAREEALRESERNIEYLRKEMAATVLPSQQQAISKVLESEMQQLMLARGSEEFAFKVVDPALVPKRPFKPRRKMLVAMGVALGAMLGGLIACICFIDELRMPPSRRGKP